MNETFYTDFTQKRLPMTYVTALILMLIVLDSSVNNTHVSDGNFKRFSLFLLLLTRPTMMLFKWRM